MSRDHFSADPLGHDRWYLLLALAIGRVRFIEDDLLIYRQHGANTYGADARLGLMGRVRERLRHYALDDDYAAEGARSRAAVLRAVSARLVGETHPRLERLVEAYEAYAARLERRSRTFGDASLLARGASLARSVAHGDYRGNPWGFDPRSVVRDMLTGVAKVGR
jgi:hypothetical protein